LNGTRGTILVALAIVAALWWAQIVLIPLVLGIFMSYALHPVYRRLTSWHVPHHLAAILIVMALMGALAGGAVLIRQQATGFIDRLPVVTERLRSIIRNEWVSSGGAVGQVQKAATDLKHATDDPGGTKGVTRVLVEEPGFKVSDLLWRGSIGIVDLASQATVVLFLAYYLLASNGLYERKIVKMAGTLSQKKATVEILRDVSAQIERFVIARIAISVVVGTSTGLAFWLLGVSSPAIWGIGAGILDTIPYFGPTAFAAAAAINGLLQFGTGGMAALLGGVALAIAAVEGIVLTPWLMGRAGQMNTGAVFVGLSVWGWLWGIWGLLLAVPIMMAIKVLCDHIDRWNPVGELLGE